MTAKNNDKIPRVTRLKKERHKNTMKKRQKTRSFQAGRDHVAKTAKFHSPQAIKWGVRE